MAAATLLEKFKDGFIGKLPLNKVSFSDTDISRTLLVSQALIKRMLGSSVSALDLTDPSIEEAVLLLTKYLCQNRQFYERQVVASLSTVLTETEMRKFESELSGAVYRQIIGLIGHKRAVKDFMPDVSVD